MSDPIVNGYAADDEQKAVAADNCLRLLSMKLCPDLNAAFLWEV